MSNKIQEFQSDVLGNVRCFKNEDNVLWFVATDVAKALEYRDSFAMTRLLDDDEKGTHLMSTLGGSQTLTVLNESGLYNAIFRVKNSKDKPERYKKVQEFRKWITSTVMPNLREDGMYVDGEEDAKTVEELDELLDSAYERKVLRKYGIDVRKSLTSVIANNLDTSNKFIYATVTDHLIYKPLFSKTAKQLKELHNVKKLRDDLFTNEELVNLAKQEEFVSNLICRFQDYGKVKEIVLM